MSRHQEISVMSIRILARSLPILVAGSLLAAPVMAQTPAVTAAPPASPAAPTPVPAPAPGKPTASASTTPARAHPVVEKRIEELRARLKITPDQTKAFDDYAQVVRDNSIRMDTLLKDQASKVPTMTALDFMKAHEAVTQEQADDMARQVPAFSRLYDMLTPAQKKVADDGFREYVAGHRKH
jgi:3-oxoacyl-ACP reductase-like protein